MSPKDKPESTGKLWSGRFVGFDIRLAEFDIQGSLAHARMLRSVGLLTDDDLAAIEQGLSRIGDDIRSGKFEWSLDLEDVHLNIEKRLGARMTQRNWTVFAGLAAKGAALAKA